MNKTELQAGFGHDRSQGCHTAAGAESALCAAWMQKRLYPESLQPAPLSPPRLRPAGGAVAQPIALQAACDLTAQRLPLNPGRPSLQGTYPLPRSPLPPHSPGFYYILQPS